MKTSPLFAWLLLGLVALTDACNTTTPAPNTAPEPVATTADETTIQELRVASNAAIARRDSVTPALQYAPDYTIITSRSGEGKGPAFGQRAFYLEFTNKKEAIYERIPEKIRVYDNWKMASEVGRWTGSWVEADGKIQLAGTYMAKWHKLNGQWKIRAEVFVPLTCQGSNACNNRPF
jgi:ketosteroid isomerase-like protein